MARLIEREDGIAADPNEGESYVDLNAEENLGDTTAVNLVAEEDLVPAPVEDEPESDIPDKYKGKSMQDIIAMHQEAEKWAGRQSGELGELRKTVDSLIQAQLAAPTQAAPAKESVEEEVDFFADPEAAVERAIANHPKIKAAEQSAAEHAREAALTALQRKHPDMGELMGSEQFGEWVATSAFRTRLMQQAHNNYDTEAADELFSLYKEHQQVVGQTVSADKGQRQGAVKTASTGEARTSGPAPSKRIYRRADVMKLMQTDPDRYAALADEILQAYAEGRVRN